MKSWKSLKAELLKNEEVSEEYAKLAPRYELIAQLIEARIKKGFTQKQLAEKVGTKQSAIARVESGRENFSIGFLEKLSRATDSTLTIQIK